MAFFARWSWHGCVCFGRERALPSGFEPLANDCEFSMRMRRAGALRGRGHRTELRCGSCERPPKKDPECTLACAHGSLAHFHVGLAVPFASSLLSRPTPPDIRAVRHKKGGYPSAINGLP